MSEDVIFSDSHIPPFFSSLLFSSHLFYSLLDTLFSSHHILLSTLPSLLSPYYNDELGPVGNTEYYPPLSHYTTTSFFSSTGGFFTTLFFLIAWGFFTHSHGVLSIMPFFPLRGFFLHGILIALFSCPWVQRLLFTQRCSLEFSEIISVVFFFSLFFFFFRIDAFFIGVNSVLFPLLYVSCVRKLFLFASQGKVRDVLPWSISSRRHISFLNCQASHVARLRVLN